MAEPKAKVCHYTDVPAEPVGLRAPGATMRWLIDDARDGAPVYALRMVEIGPGGNSPHHQHNYEHENFVVEGKGRVFLAGEWHDLKPGDVVFVPPGVEHEYVNAGDTTFRFLCGIPVTKLRPSS
ncbi:MAG TPA: cupin domain-containing protein [Vicinamibacterales bacterium]|nr:cupin domain-containing protein [Vicinamibacterales bacterium]HPW21151.1 cupin domain-containing protein [Vicinamibacterales bacterium]